MPGLASYGTPCTDDKVREGTGSGKSPNLDANYQGGPFLSSVPMANLQSLTKNIPSKGVVRSVSSR